MQLGSSDVVLPNDSVHREKYWSKEFADGITFIGDPVVAYPDVSEVTPCVPYCTLSFAP